MRPSILLLLSWGALLAACGRAGPDVAVEAEALVQQGQLEEAAAKVDLICAFTPDGDPCRASAGHAAEIRVRAAEKALTDGRFGKAERLFVAALDTPDAKAAESAAQRLAADDLKQGLAYERALTGGEKRSVAKAMEAIAATATPAAARALGWLDKERTWRLVAAVSAACGPVTPRPPARDGSCSKAAASQRAAGTTGPDVDAAALLADEEERRVFPIRQNAEVFLKNFAARSKLDKLANECKAARCDKKQKEEEAPESELCSSVVADEPSARRTKERATAYVWRKAMREIADPELVSALEGRMKKALETGEYDTLDIPKPRPAPKK